MKHGLFFDWFFFPILLFVLICLSAPNTVRGVYLPLLESPGDCVKEPLVVFFDGGHFTALCRIDDAEPTPGLVQLDFVVERANVDRFGRVRGRFFYTFGTDCCRSHLQMDLLNSGFLSYLCLAF